MGASPSTSTSSTINTYSVYQLPYISSAISISDNLPSCLTKTAATDTNGLRSCITKYISAVVPTSGTGVNVLSGAGTAITYIGPDQTTTTTTTADATGTSSSNSSTVQPAKTYPTNKYSEDFSSNNEIDTTNIESNKIFCFSGTFTLLTIFVLILLLIFINVNTKNTINKPLL